MVVHVDCMVAGPGTVPVCSAGEDMTVDLLADFCWELEED